MKRPSFPLFAVVIALVCPVAASAQGPTVIPVNSPAFVFSPGNWTGDVGRGGSVYRQTWNAGAYLRVSWSTPNPRPAATILLDTSTYGTAVASPPDLTYNVDGVWTDGVPCKGSISVLGLTRAGGHVLTVYVRNTAQSNRWGSPGASGENVVRVTGLQVDSGSTPKTAIQQPKWALEIGDSITEGILANNGQDDNLADYSYFVGQALQTQGYEYGVSACGYSGWLRPGDATSDVPGYYVVSGGAYDDGKSRWNKMDGNGHSLLDRRGHLSAYGGTGQEPSLITINYGTNDALNHTDPTDTQASITQGLAALRQAAPKAVIFVIIPFGQFDAALLQKGVQAYQSAHRRDAQVFVIDLGQPVANALGANGFWGGLHPNMRGHAVFSSQILTAVAADTRRGRGGW